MKQSDEKSNALRGTRGRSWSARRTRSGAVLRGLVAITFAVAGLVTAGVATAGKPKPAPTAPTTTTTTTTTTTSSSGSSTSSGTSSKAFITKTLLGAAKAKPDATFDVIVKGRKGSTTVVIESEVNKIRQSYPSTAAKGVKTKFNRALNGLAANLSGRQIERLVDNGKIFAITKDAPVAFTDLSNSQLWPSVSQVAALWPSSLAAPGIAIVDTGIDSSRAADFGNRIAAEIKMTPGRNNSQGNGRGHGTMVASIAAGAAPGYAGAAAAAQIVAIDVMDDDGTGRMSDVVAAADWILANKDRYGIRVANFSLHGSETASFMYDPLCQAVEKLWLNGVVVVAAAGNYATGGAPSGVLYAPANDPFVITVGAADIRNTLSISDDFAAPWSAHGYTVDGFAKPELGAPGRYMNGAVPVGSTMYTERPERIVAPGYMWMSGTSFAAPVVAGAAAQLLALHPTWTPDDVKGALMLTARPAGSGYALGVGEIRAEAAAAVVSPPNPNLGLNTYVVSDPDSGTRMFDTASWTSAAKANASWNSASWTSASWTSASWTSASWTSASWTSASWTSGQTTDGTLPTASWTSATWVG
jgi:serine protease AprX